MPIIQKIKLFYDPLGNVIRTVNPDNTEQWVIHGKPHALSSVEVKNHWSFNGYDPTPWESYTYDANDLATKTGYTATGHEFTPASAYIDPLGRPVKSIARLGTAPTDEVVTQQRYDIQGNVLYVEDALNRIVFRHKYGIGKQLLWKEHIDSGVSTLVADATGKPITAIDAREAQVLTAYDALSRPVKVWAKEQPSDPYTLRQVSKYAENELGITAAKEKNIVGQLYQHFDEAGLNQIERCDYKGNPLEKVKQVISDATLLAAGTTSYTVDWTNSPSILDSTEYRTTIEYDALNRGTKLTLPKDINNHRAVIEPVFNTAGALERIKKDNVEYVKHIAYNAKGQQLLVVWKNDIMMRFAYDEHTFRLKRVKAERYTIDINNPNQYNYNSGNTRYDQGYVHDLVGNIIAVNDTTPDCGLSNTNDELERLFEYDALYRLIKGTGRESNSVNNQFWTDPPQTTTPNANNCRAYEQRYEYDQVGNMQKLIHTASGNNFTRKYEYQSNTNKHIEINDGQGTPTTLSDFQYDAVGNQTNANVSREYSWDAFGRLKLFKVSASGSVSKYAHYTYDAGGQRAKKIVVKQNGDFESVTYVDGVFEYRKNVTNNGGTTQEKNYLQLQGGIEIRVGGYTGDMTETEVYTISDHLGSGGTRLSNTGSIIDTEEYYPYGDSSLRTFGSKRYRYCGKERDEESGLYYMAARYYCSSTAKFISVDPLAGKYAHQSSYCYADCNPMMKNDPSGMGADKTVDSDSANITATVVIHTPSDSIATPKVTKSDYVSGAKIAEDNIKENFKDRQYTTPEGKSLPVKANLNFIVLPYGSSGIGVLSPAVLDSLNGTSVDSNIIDLEIDDMGAQRSNAEQGGTKMHLNSRNILSGGNTPFHEFLHILGLSDRYNYSQTPIGRRGDISNMWSINGRNNPVYRTHAMPAEQVGEDKKTYAPMANVMANTAYNQVTNNQWNFIFSNINEPDRQLTIFTATDKVGSENPVLGVQNGMVISMNKTFQGASIQRENREIWGWTNQNFTKVASESNYPEIRLIMPNLIDANNPMRPYSLKSFAIPYSGF